MPLVIGDIHATITVVQPKIGAESRDLGTSVRDSEHERMRAVDAVRLEAERRIDVRETALSRGR
jgi:hypothetical protein